MGTIEDRVANLIESSWSVLNPWSMLMSDNKYIESIRRLEETLSVLIERGNPHFDPSQIESEVDEIDVRDLENDAGNELRYYYNIINKNFEGVDQSSMKISTTNPFTTVTISADILMKIRK